MNDEKTQEYINTTLLDIERKTNVGEFKANHENILIDLINRFDESWSDPMFEFLIDSPICDTYPSVMTQLIKKINPYLLNHNMIKHILVSKCELKHVVFLEKIYDKTKENYNQNLINDIANKIEQLFFENFQENGISIDDCVNFFVSQKISPNYENYQYKIRYIYDTDIKEFQNRLTHITEKCLRLDKKFFLTYLENLRDFIDPDEIELVSKHLPFIEKSIEEYKIKKESLNLDLALNNKVSEKKKIKI
jgi:hypothetical protein